MKKSSAHSLKMSSIKRDIAKRYLKTQKVPTGFSLATPSQKKKSTIRRTPSNGVGVGY